MRAANEGDAHQEVRASDVLRFMVIDDERKSVAGLCSELRARNIRVDEVHSKQEALEKLKTNAYNGIALDLMLPDQFANDLKRDRPIAENGLAILRAIRNGEFVAAGTPCSIPVFTITGLAQEAKEALEEATRLGVSKTFTKPILVPVTAEYIFLSLDQGVA